MECPRSIKFTIHGTNGSPSVEVTAVESINGTIDFTVSVMETTQLTADLRGLFFNVADDAKLLGMTWSEVGAHKITDFDTVNTISLKNGANMNGAAQPFDVGFEFGTPGIAKDDIKSVTFTLSNQAHNLTLDDIAHVQFGARLTGIGAPTDTKRGEKDGSKLVAMAPAAPNALDDHYSMFEDGAAGLDDPLSVAKGVTFQVLDNDTDADAMDALSVLHVEGASHGLVEIVDGADADLLAGDAVRYTPDTDYAGTDAFSYCVSDGHGGMDSAHVSVDIAAVADQALIEIEVVDAPDSVNQVRLKVTATQSDNDGSEYLTSLTAGPLPAGVSITPAAAAVGIQPGQVVQEFMLTLPSATDVDYLQLFSADSQEISNGDAQTSSGQVHIKQDYNLSELDASFSVDNASIWANGQGPDANIEGPFMGITAGPDLDVYPYPFRLELQTQIHAGFQPYMNLEGGTIDADLDYDVTVETTHNQTTDTLLISSDALLSGGHFSTQGPGGEMGVNFVFGYDIGVKFSFDLDGDLDVAQYTFVDIHDSGDWATANLIAMEAGDPSLTLDASWLNGSSASVQWPDVDVTGSSFDPITGKVTGTGQVEFLSAQSDLDSALLGSLPGNISPFDIPVAVDGIDFDVTGTGDPAEPLDLVGFIRLLDLDVSAQLKLSQSFEMMAKGITGSILFENGTSMPITFGQDLQIQNALANIDALAAGGNGNGVVDFKVLLNATAELHNQTDLATEKSLDFKLLDYDLAWDLDYGLVSDNGSIDQALVHVQDSTTELVGVYDQSFDLALGSWLSGNLV